jgi:nitrogen fixation NifU-like protein
MDLTDLYQEIIVDHNRSPRNFGKLDDLTQQAEGYNPLCGDRLTLYLRVKDGIIEDVSFDGAGCAISVASASLMTEGVKGKTEQEAVTLFKQFHELVTTISDESPAPSLGKLAALAGVRAYPTRVKCATLAWHTLDSALTGRNDAKTE